MTDTLRGCIIADDGYSFISLDASQIELRVLAYESGDPQMLLDFETGDLHQATADRMGCSRYDGKQVNFATVYGADEYKIAEMLNCDVSMAAAFLAAHRAAYPRLYQWMEEEKAHVRETGYVLSMFGRIRPIPNLHAGSFKVRQDAEREIVNTKIQGTAVDIVKLAGLYLRGVLPPQVKFVLQVHDEWLLECPDNLVEQALSICKTLPTYFPQYPFKICIGTVYNQLKEVE